MKTSQKNSRLEKESHKFEYAYDEKVEFVKVVGYKYTQNGEEPA